MASPNKESPKVPWRTGTAEGDRTESSWAGSEGGGGKWAGITHLLPPGPGTALGNDSQGFINKTEFFCLCLAHICGSKSDLKVQIHFSSLCLTTILKHWILLCFFSYPRNPKFFFGWNKWNHLLLPAVQFKLFTIPFPGLFPETWHESETVVKGEIHPPGSITIPWNSTCKARKTKLWFVQMLKSRTLSREFQVLFLIYKTEQRNSWVSSNFGVSLLICSVPAFVA